MAGKAKGSTKAKGAKTTTRRVVPDRLPPATQAEIIAVDPDKGVDRIPVLEHTSNVPYITATDLLAGGSKEAKKQLEDQKKQLEVQRKLQEEAAKNEAKATEEAYKDKESRKVQVRALSKGFYPHDGRLRTPGEIFDYHLTRDKKGKTETDLPSWMQHVDGKLETRDAPADVAAARLDEQAQASSSKSSVI